MYCFDSLSEAHSFCIALFSFLVNHVKLSFKSDKKSPNLLNIVQFIKLISFLDVYYLRHQIQELVSYQQFYPGYLISPFI